MKNNFITIDQPEFIEVEGNSIEQNINQRVSFFKSTPNILTDINMGDSALFVNSIPLINNCNGQYFQQNCIKCGLLLKIWCTEWKACPKCGTKNYGRHYGA